MSLTTLQSFLKTLSPFPVLGEAIAKDAYLPLDLSIHNSELHIVDVSSSKALEVYIRSHLKKHKAKVAYGGYLEHRGIYQRSDYFSKENPQEERNTHLGIDLWIEADTPIFSPLDASIHSFKNNTNYGDYGPTIVLEHHFNEETFYTLYGHLNLASIEHLKEGTEIKKGQQIAALGTAEVNGDYPPHLHFQIIKDLQNFKGDYPGVSNRLDLEFYKNNCPDPNLILKLS